MNKTIRLKGYTKLNLQSTVPFLILKNLYTRNPLKEAVAVKLRFLIEKSFIKVNTLL